LLHLLIALAFSAFFTDPSCGFGLQFEGVEAGRFKPAPAIVCFKLISVESNAGISNLGGILEAEALFMEELST
jgi:hypothetical protein